MAGGGGPLAGWQGGWSWLTRRCGSSAWPSAVGPACRSHPTTRAVGSGSWSRSGLGRQTPVIGWPQRGYPPAHGDLRPAGYPAVGARWCRRTRQCGLTQHLSAHAPTTTTRVLQLAALTANDHGIDWTPELIVQAQTSPGVVHRPVDR